MLDNIGDRRTIRWYLSQTNTGSMVSRIGEWAEILAFRMPLPTPLHRPVVVIEPSNSVEINKLRLANQVTSF
jgi:hypothetical protein